MSHFAARMLLFVLTCLAAAGCGGGGEVRPFDGARQGLAAHATQIERFCRRADSSDACRAEVRNLETHRTVNTVPFEELCRLLGNPNDCQAEGRRLDQQFDAGETTTFYTCSRTTCYCDSGRPYDCFVMKLNHCAGAGPTEVPGSGGVMGCNCQNDCSE